MISIYSLITSKKFYKTLKTEKKQNKQTNKNERKKRQFNPDLKNPSYWLHVKDKTRSTLF